jgi:hypothetical protein
VCQDKQTSGKEKTIVGREGTMYGYGTYCDQIEEQIERNGEQSAN